MYFHKGKMSTEELENNGAILKKIKADVDYLLNNSEENKRRVFEAEKEILILNKPRSWNIYKEGNMEIEMEVEYEKYLIAVSEHTKEDIDKISVFRFDSLVNYLKQKEKNG